MGANRFAPGAHDDAGATPARELAFLAKPGGPDRPRSHALDLLRRLAAQGRCEGDRVRNATSGEVGDPKFTREDDLPRAVVVPASGSRAVVDSGPPRA